MPLYEYECSACKHRFELLQKFSDDPAKTCPKCGRRVARLLSSPSIQFKGTGWYVTDYPKKGAGAEARNDDKKSDGAEAKPAAASTEAKPAKEPSSSPSDKPAKS